MPAKARSARYADRAALQSLGLFHDTSMLKALKRKNNNALSVDEIEDRIVADLLPHQKDFVCNFDTRYILYVGGLGCMAAESLVEVWDGAKYVKTSISDLCSAPFLVKTLAGPALAFPAYRKGFATLYRVELEDGRQFLATKDHRCLSPAGWVDVGRLAAGSVIAVDGISGDSPDLKKSKDWSGSDLRDFRSCDAPHSPLEVFVQEQIEQLDQSNTLYCPFPSLQPHGLCTDGYIRRVANQMILANYETAKRIASSFPLLRNAWPALERQLRYSDIHQLHSRPQSSVLRSRSFHESQENSAILDLAFQSEFRTSRSGRFANTPLREVCALPPARQGEAGPRTKPGRLASGVEGCDLLSLGSNQYIPQFELSSFRSDASKKSYCGFDREERQACNRAVSLPHCTWSRVKTVSPIRDDYYYDFHVPVLNHYVADGVVHHNSGKSYSSVAKAILLAFRSQGHTHIYLEPTYVMLNDIAIPTWNSFLHKYDIPFTHRVSPQPSYTLHLPDGDTTILLRPLMNVERLVGINAASLVIDEADTVKQEIAEAALIKLQGRVRVGNCPQICFVSTPEGRKFIWGFFEKNKSDDKQLYRADTRDNPYLDENYVKDLLEKYPTNLVDAYVKGEFVNLETTTVFSEFIRDHHSTNIFCPEAGEPILIGCDFNVGKVSSVYAVMRPLPSGGQALHIFDENISRDTFSLAEHIKRKYAAHLARNMVMIYPDSSGSHASTSSTMSDHDILRETGAKVIADRRNPPIAETVGHANNCFNKGQIFINCSSCHESVEMLENWGYDASLRPSKGGKLDYSHFGDALRYLVWQTMPRPAIGLGRGQRWR